MSKVTKRKHVMKEMQTDDFDHPTPNQQIVRIVGSRGNNLHEVESAEPITIRDSSEAIDRFLASMPTKFRKNVWVKRGDFVIIEPINEGDKVKAEIVRILTPQHIKEFSKDGIWPEKFATNNRKVKPKDDADIEDDDDLFRNTNRMQHDSETSDESETESECSSDDESESNINK